MLGGPTGHGNENGSTAVRWGGMRRWKPHWRGGVAAETHDGDNLV
jgi:hypothetical protein